ncbi:NAD(P)-binding protein [Hypoxylon sp. FL1284]|nr:NAD(P)-binding protein [Hypoxylon sp. FL1284]
MIADLKLSPGAQELVDAWSAADGSRPAAYFWPTDMSDWAQISSLWKASLEKLGSVDIVCNGAGIYEPPSSSFWDAPGILPLAKDNADASPGVYKTFSVNTMGPIRLAQIAIDYWLKNRDVDGNLLFIASAGGYLHSFHTPLYFASKAAVVSFVKSLQSLRGRFGIRNAAICPGVVHTPIFDPEYCRDRVRPDDLAYTPEKCASVMLRIVTEPQYGDGNIVEAMAVGTKENPSESIREVPLEALYPTVPVGEETHLLEEEEKSVKRLQEHGMQH